MWPWNTRLVYAHLKQPMYFSGWAKANSFLQEKPLSGISSSEEAAEISEQLVRQTTSPIVLW